MPYICLIQNPCFLNPMEGQTSTLPTLDLHGFINKKDKYL